MADCAQPWGMGSLGLVNVQLQTRIRNHLLAVDFSVGNELVALLGRDGSGKTEILRSIAGVYAPENGAIEIQGRTLYNPALAIEVPAAQRHVGWVPKVSALFPQQSVAENVRFPFRRGHSLSEAEGERRIDETLEMLRLSDRRNRLVQDLHPREQFWVALARTLVLDPELLLIDQPFQDIDVALQRKLRHDIQRIRRLISVPALIATTDLEEAYEIADRIALLDNGQLLQIDPPRTLVTRPRNRAVADLVRSVNIFPARIVERYDRGVVVQTDLGVLQVSGINPDSERLEAVIRPEHIRILADDETPSATDNVVYGTVLDTTDYGALLTLLFQPDGASSSSLLEISVSEPRFRQLDLAARGRRTIALPSHAIHLMQLPRDEHADLESHWMSGDQEPVESQEPLL